MDGIEATIEIRQLGTAITQPQIVAVTANAMAEDRARCIKAGMNDFLAKTYTAQELSAVIETALENMRNRRADLVAAAGENQMPASALLDIGRAKEVLEQINESTPGAFDDWIVRLDAEANKFTQLVAVMAAVAGVDALSSDTLKKIQFAAHSLNLETAVERV